MIIKSFIILSLIFNSVGFTKVSDKFDNAVIRDRSNPEKVAIASDTGVSLPQIFVRPKVKDVFSDPQINTQNYILADPDSGVVFAKKNYKDHVPIASTTKIMTAIVALENYKLNDVVTISEKASTQIGADSYLRIGEKITVENLLKCLLIKSGNDAAYALAEHMNSNNEEEVDEFVAKMNEKAKALGMNDSKYEDPAGLNVTGYSSAFDLYLATKYALKNDTFAHIVRQEKDSAKNIDGTIWHELNNSNRLVAEYHYPGAIGVKTGYMPEAGHCLVGAAKREGHILISIILNTYADTASASADESRRLLDWGYSNISWQ